MAVYESWSLVVSHIAKGTFKSQGSARVAGKTSRIAMDTAETGTSASASKGVAAERPGVVGLLLMVLSATRTGQHLM